MAAIFEFDKTMSNGFVHRFLLLQDDEGNFTDIARGGPQSSVVGSEGLPSSGVRSGAGFGSLITDVVPCHENMVGAARNDFRPPEQLAEPPNRRCGLVQGRVRKLGRDAATNPNAAPPGSLAAMPQQGSFAAPPAELAYPAKVTLLQDWILVDGRHEQIRVGMRVSAEIKTGDRRVIEYLLSRLCRW
jgi:hypothetical protein